MHLDPELSIITVVLNNEISIEHALQSVISQKNRNYEYIVIDGGSSDNTLEVIKKHEKNISKFITGKDKGIYDAMNQGISLSSGKYIGFLNSDDVFAEDKTLAFIKEIIKKEDPDVIYGDIEYVDKNDVEKVIRYWDSKEFNSKNLKYGWMPPHPSFYIKKEVYDKHGFYDLKYKISADYDLMTRILLDKTLKVSYLPKVFVRMRVGGESNRFSNVFKKLCEDFRIIKSNKIGGLSTLFLKSFLKIPQYFINKK